MYRLLPLVAGALIASASAGVPMAGAATVLFASGTGGAAPALLKSLLADAYSGDDFIPVDYPASFWPFSGLTTPTLGASISAGADSLTALARSTPGPLVIAGFSQGAAVVQQAARDLNDDPMIGSDTTVVMIANPNLGMFAPSYGHYIPVLDYVPQPIGETRFTTVVIANEYDAWVDPITRAANPLSLLNALMGMAYLHPVAFDTDLTSVPPQNITTTVNSQGGTTTTYLVPATELPLTMPLRQLGLPQAVVDSLDRQLRPVIDASYARDVTPEPRTSRTPVGAAAQRREGRTEAASPAERRGSSSPRGEAGTSAPR